MNKFARICNIKENFVKCQGLIDFYLILLYILVNSANFRQFLHILYPSILFGVGYKSFEKFSRLFRRNRIND